MARAVEAETDLRPELKWPNDLLLNGRKLSGILTEIDAEEGLTHFVLTGVGLNANIAAGAFPDELAPIATSLQAERGTPVDRARLLRSFFAAYEKLTEAINAGRSLEVIEAWRAWPNTLGRRVRVTDLTRTREGIAAGLDDSGALLLQRENGDIERILAGDVALVDRLTPLAV
jgi:BirA family biotin operon repressor/biotin-[acetyl-CoA-carboxylase] ligase